MNNRKQSALLALPLCAALWLGPHASAPVHAEALQEEAQAVNAEHAAPLKPLMLLGSEPLYDAPQVQSAGGLLLAPQTVTPIGFDSESGFYLISTWMGDKWIYPSQGVVENIEPADESILLDAPAYLFNAPQLGLNTGETVSGSVQVAAKWRMWLQIRTDEINHSGSFLVNI